MSVKNLYQPKEKEKSIYSSSNTANSSRTAAAGTQNAPQNNVWNAEQSTPQVQSYTPQKRKREKSPSELGEEALGLMLSEDALEARQPTVNEGATAQPPANTRQEESATRLLANARPGEHTFQSTQRSDLFTSPQQMFGGMAGSAYTAPTWQPMTASQNPTTVAANRGSQSTPDWQLPATAATQNLKSTAPNGSTSGDPAYTGRLSSEWQQAWKPADPIQPTLDSAQPAREELLLAAAPDLAAAGIDMNAVRAGLWLGDQVNQIAEDSYLAPDTSPLAYVGENFLSGGWSTLENGWNGFIDYALPFANAALDQQMGENEQLALIFGGDFRQYLDSQNALLQEVRDGMPEAIETLRRHDAAAYQQSILDRYDPHGAYIPIGEISSGVGQGVTQMGLSAINPAVAAAQQFFSASGSKAQEARENGASDELALLGGGFSGIKELLNNKFFGGIPFLGDSFADDLAMQLASTDKGRAILKAIFNIGGEGLEEGIGTYEDAFISRLWNGDDRGVWQTIKETTPDAIHAGLISMGTSSILTPFSFVPEYRDARIVDEALDIMNNGGMLTDTHLADAKAAMRRLMGDGHNSWNGLPFDEWTDTLNKHLTGQLSPAANSSGNAADLTGIDTSNLIMFPMLNDTNAQTNATADSNAIPFPAANSAAAAQNGQTDLSNSIHLPMGAELTAPTNTSVGDNSILFPGTNGTTVQNGQTNLPNLIHFPTGEELAALVNAGTDFDSISSLTAANQAAAQNGQPDSSNLNILPMLDNPTAIQENQTDSSNLIMLPMLNDSKPQTNAAVSDNTISFPEANNAIVQNGQTDVSETASQTSPSQNAADLTAELTAEKTAGENTLQTDPAADAATPEMIARQNATIREQTQEKAKARDGGQTEMSPETKNILESTGKTGETSFPTEEMSVEGKKDVANAAAQEYNENKGGRRVEIIDGVKHYYDDNGNLYRVKNDLQPNCEYELNGYKYQTDDIRRIRFAEGILHLKERVGRLPIRDSIEDIGKGDQKKGDNRGHLIGDQFDASSGLENLVPQDAKVNQKDFRNFENKLAAEVKNGKEVYVRVEPVYEGNSRRPSSIEVTYRINGAEYTMSFRNGKE